MVDVRVKPEKRLVVKPILWANDADLNPDFD